MLTGIRGTDAYPIRIMVKAVYCPGLCNRADKKMEKRRCYPDESNTEVPIYKTRLTTSEIITSKLYLQGRDKQPGYQRFIVFE